MFPLSKTKQIFSVLIIINLILLAGLVGVYYFLENRTAEAAQLGGRVDSVQNRQQRESTLNKLVDDTAEARETLDEFFVQPNEAARFITTIEGLAKETGVQLEIGNVSIQSSQSGGATEDDTSGDATEKTDNMFENLELTLQANGSWQQTIHFVRMLELLPKQTKINSVSIEQSRETTDQGSVSSSWTVVTTITARKLSGQ